MSYARVMERVGQACARVERDPGGVTVVAVSKTKTVEEIMHVYELGHRDFGENRAQELAAKAPDLPDDIRWHFVGALQSNKARQVRPIASLLHSLDRRSLAKAWLKGPGTAPAVLLQVNIGREQQKAGLDPDEVVETAEWARSMTLDVRGLMAIPPIPADPEDSRPFFQSMRQIFDECRRSDPSMDHLSMGMTDDFEVAIEEGASIIRVGRAIFGARN